MEECEFCGEEFEAKEDLKVHWLEDHEDEINSHQKDEAKEAKRKQEERNEQVKARRKKYLYQGVGVAIVLLMGVLLGPQVIDAVMPNNTDSLDLEGEPVLGNESAEVTVVEFGDFQCPACSRFEQGAFSQIKSDYVDTGQVRFVWKDYPLTQIHEWAEPGAAAMECVYREDEQAFWNIKSKLFDEQSSLNLNNVEDRVVEWAGQEGVNTTEVRSCIDDGSALQEVREDLRGGQQNGVTGTPTVFVNGQQVDSSYQAISNAIDQELEN